MSYFIKPTYPSKEMSNPSILFKSWVTNVDVKDIYGNWNVIGDVYIFSNTYLPNYSFYLNFKTYFANVSNIALNWNQKIYTENISNSNDQAYVIDKFNFKFNLNINDSKIFDKWTKLQSIDLNFMPSFNQGIFNDYKIESSLEDKKKFINQIDNTNMVKNILYKGSFDLNDTYQNIYFSPNQNNSKDLISISTNNFIDSNAPINSLINIKRFDKDLIKLVLGKADIKYKVEDNETKELKINIDSCLLFKENDEIKINKSFYFDEAKNILVEDINGHKGLFFTKPTIGIIKAEFILEYKQQVKKIYLERQFSFEFSFNNLVKKNISFEKNESEKYEMELESANIF